MLTATESGTILGLRKRVWDSHPIPLFSIPTRRVFWNRTRRCHKSRSNIFSLVIIIDHFRKKSTQTDKYGRSVIAGITTCDTGLQRLGIRPYTPRHNDKVERSHRKDHAEFYASHRFYSFEDFKAQLAVRQRACSKFSMRSLSRHSPEQVLFAFPNVSHSIDKPTAPENISLPARADSPRAHARKRGPVAKTKNTKLQKNRLGSPKRVAQSAFLR